MLDWIADQFPGQAVKAVVSTHHHVDHVGGLREFAAAGATVVASAGAQDYFRRIVAAPSTIVPDTLSQNSSRRRVRMGTRRRDSRPRRPGQPGVGRAHHHRTRRRELRNAIEALDAPITTVVGGHEGGGPLADVGVGPVEELDAFLAQFG
ncbi:MAG: MBL fold metallo-hydrolase [Acidimicrobiia bacterium]|nr:MBL fold metallo-hydrolase [Acidimicrobiia bacterium]